jgi:hypothetical protein
MTPPRSELCGVLRVYDASDATNPILRGQACERLSEIEYMCSFEFPFRDNEARTLYDAYARELEVCSNFGEFAEVQEQDAVNHPDSFEQTTFDIYKGPQASISLKDKGDLQKTYVFVRLPAN